MERDILVRLTFEGGPRYSVRTEPKYSVPFDFYSKFPEFWAEWKAPLITPFYRYGGHIEFVRFKEYYGMSRAHSLSIYTRFSGKKRTSMYISREKGDHYYIQTRHNDLSSFSHYNLFSVNTDASVSDRAHLHLET